MFRNPCFRKTITDFKVRHEQMISDLVPKTILNINQTEKRMRNTSATLEGLCFAINVTGLNRPNAEKGR
jgi:hypothetical protein